MRGHFSRYLLYIITVPTGYGIGLLSGTEMGAVLGILMATALTGIILSLLPPKPQHSEEVPKEGEGAVVQTKSLVCIPHAQKATCTVIGDPERQLWVEVASCSLMENALQCDQNCLTLLNDSKCCPPRA